MGESFRQRPALVSVMLSSFWFPVDRGYGRSLLQHCRQRQLGAMLGLGMWEPVLVGTEIKGRTFRITCMDYGLYTLVMNAESPVKYPCHIKEWNKSTRGEN